jgi:hypothetical protein
VQRALRRDVREEVVVCGEGSAGLALVEKQPAREVHVGVARPFVGVLEVVDFDDMRFAGLVLICLAEDKGQDVENGAVLVLVVDA